MKPASEDLEQRRPVWVALSELFLDADPAGSRSWHAGVLAASPYTLDELQEILLEEVYPACYTNLLSMSGEWVAFDPVWLEDSILRRLSSPLRSWGRTVMHLLLPAADITDEWNLIKQEVRRYRSAQQTQTDS